MTDAAETVTKKTGSRVETLLIRFEELVEKARSIGDEAEITSELITGDKPKESEILDKRDEPTNILSSLEEISCDIKFHLLRIDSNLDHLKEQIGTGRYRETKSNK